MKTFVIAEAGSTWRIGRERQHLERAEKCIQIAKKAGADAVKFQWTSNPTYMEQRRHVPLGSYSILAWPPEWLGLLTGMCERNRIEFMCTVFLAEDVHIAAPFVRRFKIATDLSHHLQPALSAM